MRDTNQNAYSRRAARSLSVVIFACILAPLFFLSPTWGQISPKPLSKDDVLKLLKGDVPIARVETLAQERGIEFPMTPDTEAELRQAGANESLLATLRALTPKPTVQPSPQSTSPTNSTPSSATVLTLATQKDRLSYALGMNVGKSLKKDSIDVDPGIVLQGLRDTLAGNKLLLTDAEAQAVLTQVQNDLRKAQKAKSQVVGDVNRKEGQEFLAANKSKQGVVTLPSGLQYKILQKGTGPKPKATDSVVCNYRGTLIDNTEFDSSYKRGQAATFPLNGVIKGWTEALQLMPVGSKWQFFIPPDLAYGELGAGNTIGPNATLIFEVELLSIKSQ